jgi:hypothetical protein
MIKNPTFYTQGIAVKRLPSRIWRCVVIVHLPGGKTAREVVRAPADCKKEFNAMCWALHDTKIKKLRSIISWAKLKKIAL